MPARSGQLFRFANLVPELRSQHMSFHLETSKDLDALLENIGERKIVMLGEASHGTHEYYTWRTAISKRLIKEKNFSFIAVEGDWPDCYRINRFIKQKKGTQSSV